MTGPYALSRLTWAGLPILLFVLASYFYCAMLMVSHNRFYIAAQQNELTCSPASRLPPATVLRL